MSVSVLNTDASISAKTITTNEANGTISGIKTFSNDVKINATKKLYLDGGTDTYLHESADNTVAAVIGGSTLLTLTGTTFTWAGFGTHTFSAGGTAGNVLAVRNTTAGAGNFGQIIIGNDTTAALLAMHAFSSTYLGEAYRPASSATIEANGLAGLSITALHASGAIRFYSGGGALALTISAANQQLVATAGYGMTTWPTTANAANAWVGDANLVSRSTSSLRYKTDIERLDAARAKSVIASLSPITYRGINDGPTRFAGFAAEEVAELDPMLVTYDKEGRPDYVTYDRIPAYLVPVVQNLLERVEKLEKD